jgi:alpha-L-fucosidase 2
MRSLLAALAITLVLWSASATAATQQLWYTHPAAKWEEALPVGSGRLGAMVFGGTAEERIQFNEDTLWLGRPHNYVRAGSADIVPQVQQLLAEGKVIAAQDLARSKMLSDPVRQLPYQPFGDLRLSFPGHAAATDYHRELDLETAVARTRYTVAGVTFTREVIASYPDNVIAVHLTASQPGALTFTMRLDSPHKATSTSATGGAMPTPREASLVLAGRVQADGLRFESRVRVVPTGGSIHADGNALVVTGADSATLLLVAATSFNSWEDISADPGQRTSAVLADLANRDFASLLATHTADHQRLFRPPLSPPTNVSPAPARPGTLTPIPPSPRWNSTTVATSSSPAAAPAPNRPTCRASGTNSPIRPGRANTRQTSTLR